MSRQSNNMQSLAKMHLSGRLHAGVRGSDPTPTRIRSRTELRATQGDAVLSRQTTTRYSAPPPPTLPVSCCQHQVAIPFARETCARTRCCMRSGRASGAQQRGPQDDQLISTAVQPSSVPASAATPTPADAQQYVFHLPQYTTLFSPRSRCRASTMHVALMLQATPVQGCNCNGRRGASGWQV